MRFVLRMALGMLMAPFLIAAFLTAVTAPFVWSEANGSLELVCFGLVGEIFRSPTMIWQVVGLGLMTACVWQAIDRHRAGATAKP